MRSQPRTHDGCAHHAPTAPRAPPRRAPPLPRRHSARHRLRRHGRHRGGSGAPPSTPPPSASAPRRCQALRIPRLPVTPAGSYLDHRGPRPPASPGPPAPAVGYALRSWPDTGTGGPRAGGHAGCAPEEAAVETGFLVDTADWVRAELDGHPLQWLRCVARIRQPAGTPAARIYPRPQ
ncbi:hypothetical protein ACRAWF_22920 [Streptomyces sp. L7]